MLQRAASLNEVTQRIRIRELILSDPMSEDLEDDELEQDYIDDPSMPTANEVLQRVIICPEVEPPAYRGQAPGPAMCAMTVSGLNDAIAPPTMPHDMTTRARIGRRPVPRRLDQTCLSFMMKVNGLDALVLMDSGSTGDSMSPEFARVCGAPTFELENPATLQLGCVGSRSRINYGTKVPIQIGNTIVETYLDIVNLDRYDVVLSTPFMRQCSAEFRERYDHCPRDIICRTHAARGRPSV